MHPLCWQSPASRGSAEMTQLGSAPPTWSNLTKKKRAELMFVGSAGFFTRCELHPPDETPNELVRNANIKHQPRCLSCDRCGIRSVGVRCAQSSRTRLECFDFCRRLLLERRSWFHPRPHASLRFLRLGVKHMQPPPAVGSCGKRDAHEE